MKEKTIKVVNRVPKHLLGLTDQIKDYIFSNRNIKHVDQLDYSIRNLINPGYFKDLELAIKRLINALLDNESIVIIGDYDCDGATSTALMYMSLKLMGFTHVHFIIPDRVIHGYGLSPELIDLAKEKHQASLIITVDNGISSFKGVEHANELGVDVIITDHHLAGDLVPNAVAIINPNQKDCLFPSKNLAGVGVAYYLMRVLNFYIRQEFELIAQGVSLANAVKQERINEILSEMESLSPEQREAFDKTELDSLKASLNLFLELFNPEVTPDIFLDLVAIGTVADLANLDYNNRILVEQGIRRIRAGHCGAGVKALLRVQKIAPENFSVEDISFKVAPLINAIGRMKDMTQGVLCLISQDAEAAERIALEMYNTNQKRALIQVENSLSAVDQFQKQFKDQDDRCSICLFDPSWHQGIIGLNCSMIRERYWRPTFIFSLDESSPGYIKGSGRSISSLHIKDCLDLMSQRYPGLIEKFGGHAGACGVTIKQENYEWFTIALENTIRENFDLEEIGQEVIYCDLELPVDYINLNFAKELARLGPWGKGFTEPIFKAKFKVYNFKLVGKSNDNLLLELADADNNVHRGIKFKVTEDWRERMGAEIVAYFSMSINRFSGRESLVLFIKHWEPA